MGGPMGALRGRKRTLTGATGGDYSGFPLAGEVIFPGDILNIV